MKKDLIFDWKQYKDSVSNVNLESGANALFYFLRLDRDQQKTSHNESS